MFWRDDLVQRAFKRLAAFIGAKLPSGLLEPLGLLSLGHLSLRWRLSLRLFGPGDQLDYEHDAVTALLVLVVAAFVAGLIVGAVFGRFVL
jgi:hypothetical protein